MVVLGVNAAERDDPEGKAKAFVAEHGVTHPTLMDTEGTMTAAYGIRAFPTLVVIDRKGALRYFQAGYNEAAVVAQVEALLAEK